jgi:hypothetical protein
MKRNVRLRRLARATVATLTGKARWRWLTIGTAATVMVAGAVAFVAGPGSRAALRHRTCISTVRSGLPRLPASMINQAALKVGLGLLDVRLQVRASHAVRCWHGWQWSLADAFLLDSLILCPRKGRFGSIRVRARNRVKRHVVTGTNDRGISSLSHPTMRLVSTRRLRMLHRYGEAGRPVKGLVPPRFSKGGQARGGA